MISPTKYHFSIPCDEFYAKKMPNQIHTIFKSDDISFFDSQPSRSQFDAMCALASVIFPRGGTFQSSSA